MVIDPNTLISGMIAIVVAIFGSGGFWQYLSQRSNKELKQTVESVKNDVAHIKEEEERKEIQNARRRILRFNDEILNEISHSKEYFDDILTDIDLYRNYCTQNPGFKNGKAVLAIENIERIYRKCTEEHKFL